MIPRRSTFGVGVALAIAFLELSHPTWSGVSISEGVAAAGAWWIPLHVLLIVGYGVLVWVLRGPSVVTRAFLGLFAASNTVFLAIDGVAVGALSQTDPVAADALWNSPPLGVLATLTGAAWAAALLAAAAALSAGRERRPVVIESSLTWVTFVASGFLPFAGAISRVLAVASGVLAVQATGRVSVPFALLVFAAVLRQHVGSEAALGMLCIALALALRGRSGPAAESPP
jgi:hypothetical protein